MTIAGTRPHGGRAVPCTQAGHPPRCGGVPAGRGRVIGRGLAPGKFPVQRSRTGSGGAAGISGCVVGGRPAAARVPPRRIRCFQLRIVRRLICLRGRHWRGGLAIGEGRCIRRAKRTWSDAWSIVELESADICRWSGGCAAGPVAWQAGYVQDKRVLDWGSRRAADQPD